MWSHLTGVLGYINSCCMMCFGCELQECLQLYNIICYFCLFGCFSALYLFIWLQSADNSHDTQTHSTDGLNTPTTNQWPVSNLSPGQRSPRSQILLVNEGCCISAAENTVWFHRPHSHSGSWTCSQKENLSCDWSAAGPDCVYSKTLRGSCWPSQQLWLKQHTLVSVWMAQTTNSTRFTAQTFTGRLFSLLITTEAVCSHFLLRVLYTSMNSTIGSTDTITLFQGHNWQPFCCLTLTLS